VSFGVQTSRMGLKQQKKLINPLGILINLLSIICLNCPTTNTRRPIKCSKDADFCLVAFKKINKKLPLRVGAQGQVT